jgi:hypothetical protein
MKSLIKVLCVLFLFIHLGIISMFSIVESIESYCVLYHKKIPAKNIFFKSIVRFIYYKPVAIYSKYTGAETCYGFYAPNVMSSGYVEIQKDGKLYGFKMSNQENQIRYMNLCNVFVSKGIEDMEAKQKNEKGQIRQQTYTNIHSNGFKNVDSLYFDLLLKNMCYRFMSQHNNNDTLEVKLKICEYTNMRNYKSATDTNLTSFYAYEKKYFKHHQ